MEIREFGRRLRELREKAHMSRHQLAEKAGIDSMYLTHIENGEMPLANDKMILALARALNVGLDELFTPPSEPTQTTPLPEEVEYSTDEESLSEKEVAPLPEHEETPGPSSEPTPQIISPPRKRRPSSNLLTNFKRWADKIRKRKSFTIVVVVALVVAIAALIWLASPVKAVDISISDPAPATPGSSIYFTVAAAVMKAELLPTQSVDLYVYKADQTNSYKATCTGLSMMTATKHYSSSETGGGAVTVIAAAPGSSHEHFGYSLGVGTKSATYNITWQSPPDWPSGDYQIEVKLIAVGKQFTETKSFKMGL